MRRVVAGVVAVAVGFLVPVVPAAGHEELSGSSTTLLPAATGDTSLQDAQTLTSLQAVASALNSPMTPMNPLHQAALDFVSKDVTDTFTNATGNGKWSDAKNWSRGVLPGAGSNVRIEAGKEVIFDLASTEIHNLLVEGRLVFDPHQDTGLKLDTLVVAEEGCLQIGTEDHPVLAQRQAKIIVNRSGKDPVNDPLDLHGGVIVLGHLEAYGAEKSESAWLASVPSVGATSLSFTEAVQGWRVGDRLILGDATPEEFAVTGISGDGKTVTLGSAVRYLHSAPPGQSLVVVNVSRNVVFETEKANVADLDKRGHLMFMSGGQKLGYVGVYGFGRTDKRKAVTDPKLDAYGRLIVGTNANPRGRYAAHFHENLFSHHPVASSVKGSAVVDSPGWGFVNHSSDVVFESNTVFDVVGAAFVTEAGNERGAFRGNVAIRATGSIDSLTGRDCVQDFGHNGHGFWFQGADIEVIANVAVGTAGAAFIYFTEGLKVDGKTTKMLDGRSVGSVAMRRFSGNVAYGSGGGLETWFHNPGASAPSVVEGFTAWGLRGMGVRNNYTHNVVFRGGRLFGDPSNGRAAAFSRNDASSNLTYDHVYVSGFATGIDLPLNGKNQVIGGYFNAKIAFRVTTAISAYRSIQFTDVKDFGPLTQAVFLMVSATKFMDGNLNQAFLTDPVRLTDTIGYNGYYLVFNWQRLSATPFTNTGTALDGLTVKQLWDTYGLAPGGMIVGNEINDSRIQGGFLTNKVTLLPQMNLASHWATNKASYTVLLNVGGRRPLAGPTFNLTGKENSWNILTFNYQGMKRSVMVWYDTVAPTFQPNPSVPSTIHPTDVANGFTTVNVGGFVVDKVGNQTLQKPLRLTVDLAKLTAQTAADGTRYWTVNFTISDHAGNKSQASVKITESSSAPIRGANYCHYQQPSFGVVFGPRALSQTLLALLGLQPQRALPAPARTPPQAQARSNPSRR